MQGAVCAGRVLSDGAESSPSEEENFDDITEEQMEAERAGGSMRTAAAAERRECELILKEVPRADEVKSRVKSHREVCGASPRSGDSWIARLAH